MKENKHCVTLSLISAKMLIAVVTLMVVPLVLGFNDDLNLSVESLHCVEGDYENHTVYDSEGLLLSKCNVSSDCRTITVVTNIEDNTTSHHIPRTVKGSVTTSNSITGMTNRLLICSKEGDVSGFEMCNECLHGNKTGNLLCVGSWASYFKFAYLYLDVFGQVPWPEVDTTSIADATEISTFYTALPANDSRKEFLIWAYSVPPLWSETYTFGRPGYCSCNFGNFYPANSDIFALQKYYKITHEYRDYAGNLLNGEETNLTICDESNRFFEPHIKKSDVINSKEITIKYDGDDVVVIENDMKADITCICAKSTFTESILVPKSTVKSLILSDNMFISSGELKISCYRAGDLVEEVIFNLVARTSCDLSDCIICPNFVTEFYCLPTTYKVIAVTMMVIVGICFLLWFPWAPKLVKWILMKVKNIIMRILKSCWNVRWSQDIGKYEAILICLMIPLVLANDCTHTLAVESKLTSCEQDGLKTTCKEEFDSQIVLQKPGQVACFTTVNKDDSTNMEMYRIKFVEMIQLYTTINQYYTADHTEKIVSIANCAASNGCDQSTCSGILPGDKTIGGRLNTVGVEATRYPGVSGCTDGCEGGALGGCDTCFLVKPMCIWHRAYVVPHTTPYLVKSLGQKKTYPVVEVEVYSIAGTNYSRTSHDLLTTDKNINGVIYSIVGNLFFDETKFGADDFIMEGENKTWFVKASARNKPVRGVIGDIQSASTSSLYSNNANAFIFDPTMINVIAGDEKASVTSVRSGIAQWDKTKTILPTTFGLSSWHVNKAKEIYTAIPNPGSLVVGIKTKSPVTVQYETERACPYFTVKDTGGCVNCDDGVFIQIEAYLTCGTNAILDVTTTVGGFILGTTSIQVNTTKSIIKLTGAGTLKSISGNVCLSSITQKFCKPVDFTVNDATTIKNDEQVFRAAEGSGVGDVSGVGPKSQFSLPKVNVNVSTSWWDNFWNGLTMTGSILQTIFTYSLIFGAIGLVLAIALAVWRRKDIRRVASKYVNPLTLKVE